jgi:uncharacterized small protein (DUF1192 family)
MVFCYHCQQRHGKNYECDAVKVLRYEKLHEEIDALREENERLRVESQSASDSAFYHKSISDGLQDKLDALREENERLREQALVWHKWPENEAPEQVRCLAKDVNGSVYIGEYMPTRGMSDWLLDGFDWRDPAVIVAYAEIPKPEDR